MRRQRCHMKRISGSRMREPAIKYPDKQKKPGTARCPSGSAQVGAVPARPIGQACHTMTHDANSRRTTLSEFRLP